MKITEKSNFIKKLIFSNFLILISCFFIIFFSTNLIRDFINKRQLNREVTKLEGQLASLTEKNKELKELSIYLASQDFIEAEARQKLNMKKPGEEIIIVSNQSTSTYEEKNSNENNEIILKKLNNIHKWWNYFFKHY